MPTDEVLLGFGQLGAVFVGFISIAVVFVREDGKLAPVDALRARSILHTSILVIIGSIAPLVLNAYGVAPAQSLRGSAALGVLLGLGTSIEGAVYHLRMSLHDRRQAGPIHGAVTWGMSMIGFVLLAAIALGFSDREGDYVLAMSLGIAVSASNFVMLSVQRWLK